MEYQIVKTSNNYYKYGVVYMNENEFDKAKVKVHFKSKYGCEIMDLSDITLVEKNNITDKDVYNANYWKRYLGDRSLYIPITEQFALEKSYNTVYSEEIKKQIDSWARFLELTQKGRLYEKMVE